MSWNEIVMTTPLKEIDCRAHECFTEFSHKMNRDHISAFMNGEAYLCIPSVENLWLNNWILWTPTEKKQHNIVERVTNLKLYQLELKYYLRSSIRSSFSFLQSIGYVRLESCLTSVNLSFLIFKIDKMIFTVLICNKD
jgi:hypothetical protein